MLHMLWMILKWILILLGILLSLAVAVLLLLLFCPVRYRAAAAKESREIRADCSVTWLFHGICLRFQRETGKNMFSVRIFGIPLERWKRKKSSRRKPRKNKMWETQTPEIQTPETQMPEEEKKKEQLLESSMPEDSVWENQDLEHRPQEKQKRRGFFSSLKNKVAAFAEKLKGLGKLPETFEKISLTFRNICDKMDWWKEFLSCPRIKEAFLLVKNTGIGILKHIFPTNIQGKVIFGSEDPGVTGTVLAILGVTMPFHKNCIEVSPVFDGNSVLEGNVQLKGRIYGIVFVKAAVRIYFDKNIKYAISQWKNKEG